MINQKALQSRSGCVTVACRVEVAVAHPAHGRRRVSRETVRGGGVGGEHGAFPPHAETIAAVSSSRTAVSFCHA